MRGAYPLYRDKQEKLPQAAFIKGEWIATEAWDGTSLLVDIRYHASHEDGSRAVSLNTIL